jgi:hypothetical protein
LHAAVSPVTICSKRPGDGLFLPSSIITGIRSKTISKSSTDITRIAAAISVAQLQRGGAVQRASLNIAQNAASLTIGELSNGSIYFTYMERHQALSRNTYKQIYLQIDHILEKIKLSTKEYLQLYASNIH